MAKVKLVHEAAGVASSDRPTRTWADTHGQYLAGRAHADGADAEAIRCEEKWGRDRLRLLVSADMRERFDRQRFKFNQALWHGDLEDLRRESSRMVAAWKALDKAAEAAGAAPLPRDVWELTLSDGTVVAIVPDNARGCAETATGRKLQVYTLEEIGRLLEAFPTISKIKEAWPGAAVTRTKVEVYDPLEAIGDSKDPLDDPIPF